MNSEEESATGDTALMSSTVIVLIPYSYPGGTAASLRVFNFVEGLVACRQKVHVLALYHAPSRRSKTAMYLEHNVAEHFVFSKRYDLQFKNLFSYTATVAKSFYETVNKIAEIEKVRLAYIYDGTSYAYFNSVSKLLQRLKIPITFDITELRDSNYTLQTLVNAKDLSLKGKISNVLLFPDYYFGKTIVLKRATFFISISTSLKKYLGSYGKPVIIVPGFERFTHSTNNARPGARIKLVYVGSLIERDDPHTLKLVVDEALHHYRNVEVRFIGRYGASIGGKKYVKELQQVHGNRIVSLGEVPEDKMEEELRNADIMILSRKDSLEDRCAFPTRLAEYLALGKAILVSPIGDIPLYLTDGADAGFLSLKDVHTLSESSKAIIHRIIADSESREEMADQGNRKGRLYFDNIRNAEEVLKQV
jgi:glycosyltransferase involved in cell wall biosynthesis